MTNCVPRAAESSIGSVLVVLRSVFAFAREADFTTTDPFRGIRRGELPSPAESSKVKRVLRVDEIWRLIDVDPLRVQGSRHAPCAGVG